MPPPRKKKRLAPARKPGPARQFLIDNFTVNEQRLVCKSGHVLFLYFSSGKSILKTIRDINHRFGFESKYGQVDSVVRRAHPLMENYSRLNNRAAFTTLCEEVFVFRPSKPEPTAADCPSLESPVHPPSPALPETPAGPSTATSVPKPTPQSSAPPLLCYSVPGPSSSQSPSRLPRLRSDQMTPRKQALKKRLTFLSQEYATSIKKQRAKVKVLQEKVKSRPYKCKQLKQTIMRKNKTIRQLKTALKEQPARVQLKQLQSLTVRLRKKLSLAKAKLDSKTSHLESDHRSNLKHKDDIIRALQDNILLLQEEVERMVQANTSEITAKAGRSYCVDIRALIYDMLMCHVPTRSVPLLLQKLADHTRIAFNSIPHRTSVEQMAREIGVISELQAAETAMVTKDLTLAFDATTQEGVHVNAIHMTTKTECVVVAIDQLAGGTAVDYETHIAQSVDHLAKVYSDFHQQEYTEVRSTIISNITNTMSDRAAVNHATITKINALWQKSLNELNCHLHPLDTMASACRSSLKGLETSKGRLFGKDCVAANIVVQLDKMRYKDAKGDPKGFKIFLEDHNLPKGLLPRYRGNRLHILFHTSGVLIHHYELIKKFLCTGLVSCGGLRDSLFHDFTSETGILELCALGLLGKLLTGPWMTKFYAGPEKGLDYLAGVEVVRSVHHTIAQSAAHPMSLLDRQTDFFGGDISKDPVFHSIADFSPRTDEMRDMLTLCLGTMMSVIDRQYKKQFDIVQTDDLKTQTQTARLHNIDAEELMGMFSAAKEKAPNATLCYLSSMLRANKNHSTDYLRSKPTEEKNKIVTWAVSAARKKRTANRQRHEQMKEEMLRRVTAHKQKKEEKERKKVEKALKHCAPHQVEQLFPDLEKKEAADVNDILTGTVIGRRLCHMWFDVDTNSHKMYYGKVLKTKKKKPEVLVVAYWTPKEEEEDDAVDYDMGKFQLAADVIAGDLILS